MGVTVDRQHLVAMDGSGMVNGELPAWGGGPPPDEPPDGPEDPAPAEPLPEAASLFRRHRASDLLASRRPFEWLVKGMFSQPTYGPIGGAQKTLKTYLSSFINVGIAAGVTVFDTFEVPQARPVLVYAGEDGQDPYSERLERIARAMGVDLADVPLFVSFDSAPIESPMFQNSLARDLREVQPGHVSIDPLYVFHGGTVNASNLYERGAMLKALSKPIVDAGACLAVNDHWSKTGTGRGLERITQAGMQQWADSWVIISHRETPDVGAGEFRMLLEVGSRRWGGAEWDLDLSIGRFDVDRRQHVGDIAWAVREHRAPVGASGELERRILDYIGDEPWQHTKTDIVAWVGGHKPAALDAFDLVERSGKVRKADVKRPEGNRSVTRICWGPSSEPVPQQVPAGNGLPL